MQSFVRSFSWPTDDQQIVRYVCIDVSRWILILTPLCCKPHYACHQEGSRTVSTVCIIPLQAPMSSLNIKGLSFNIIIESEKPLPWPTWYLSNPRQCVYEKSPLDIRTHSSHRRSLISITFVSIIWKSNKSAKLSGLSVPAGTCSIKCSMASFVGAKTVQSKPICKKSNKPVIW